MVMQHFNGSNTRSDASTAIAASSATKKLQQARLENNLALVNFAPFGSIRYVAVWEIHILEMNENSIFQS